MGDRWVCQKLPDVIDQPVDPIDSVNTVLDEGSLRIAQSLALSELTTQVIKIGTLDLTTVVTQLITIHIEVFPNHLGPRVGALPD